MGVHLASPNPVRCAACYASNPEARHVDFDAATDGPVFIDPETQAVLTWQGGSVTVEEIILCESCVAAGARVLEIEPEVETGLRLQIEAAQAETALWQRRCEALQAAMSEFGPVPSHADEPAPEPEPDLTPVDPVLQEPFEPPRKRKGAPYGGYPQDFRDLVCATARRTNPARAAREHQVSYPTVTKWMKERAHA